MMLASFKEIEDLCEIYGKEEYINIINRYIEIISDLLIFTHIEKIVEEVYEMNWDEYLPKECPMCEVKWVELGNMEIPALDEEEFDFAKAKILARVLFEISQYGTSKNKYNINTLKARENRKMTAEQVKELLR